MYQITLYGKPIGDQPLTLEQVKDRLIHLAPIVKGLQYTRVNSERGKSH